MSQEPEKVNEGQPEEKTKGSAEYFCYQLGSEFCKKKCPNNCYQLYQEKIKKMFGDLTELGNK